MSVLLIAVVMVILIIIEVPGLVERKLWRDLAAFFVLLIFGFALAIFHVLRFPPF